MEFTQKVLRRTDAIRVVTTTLSKRGLLVTLILALICASPALADAATVSDLSEQLVCQCGCTMILDSCSHSGCASREAMIAQIEQRIGEGESGQEIMQAFVAQYGEKVLASPPKRGFNLIVWLFPFIGLLIGGGLIYMALRSWITRGRPVERDAKFEDEGEYEDYMHQLEKELKEFREGGFR